MTLYTPPKSNYSGLTIILSNPSRFDVRCKKLLSAKAGFKFDREVLQPCGLSVNNCEVRLADYPKPYLPHTKALLLLGEGAMKSATNHLYDDYTLQEQRGYLLNTGGDGPLAIASFLPQDACDPVNHEKNFNEFAADWEDEKAEFSEDTKDSAVSEKRHHGQTLRSNYMFWLKEDVRKLTAMMHVARKDLPKIYPHTGDTKYNIYPNSQDTIDALMAYDGRLFYLDIETDSEQNITCFAFAWDLSEVIVVPCIRYDYTKGYSSLTPIFRALNHAVSRNIPVCHNSMFDLFILAWKYNIHFPREIYDTMIAHHRLYPEEEKSLGHCISHLTMLETYHKDQGIFEPHNVNQEMKLWKYNGKDVSSMILVKEELDLRASRIPGATKSIAQGNESIYPFLMMTLQGIRFDEAKRQAMLEDNDKLLTHYLRAIKILVGKDFLPSNKQCTDYFHFGLGYDIIERSDKNNPIWNETVLRKLKLKHPDNPVIDFCLKYRGLKTESGYLKFEPWKVAADEKTTIQHQTSRDS